MGAKAATKFTRELSKNRTNSAIYSMESEKKHEEGLSRLTPDKQAMRKVVIYCYDNCPLECLDEVHRRLDFSLDELFSKKISKNKLGMIHFIDSFIFDIWPEWRDLALRNFGFQSIQAGGKEQ